MLLKEAKRTLNENSFYMFLDSEDENNNADKLKIKADNSGKNKFHVNPIKWLGGYCDSPPPFANFFKENDRKFDDSLYFLLQS